MLETHRGLDSQQIEPKFHHVGFIILIAVICSFEMETTYSVVTIKLTSFAHSH
jgi:hypothetical protein